MALPNAEDVQAVLERRWNQLVSEAHLAMERGTPTYEFDRELVTVIYAIELHHVRMALWEIYAALSVGRS